MYFCDIKPPYTIVYEQEMKNSSKILSLLLIPVLLISLSGFMLHFHYCSFQDKVFTHFHVNSEDNRNFQCCPKEKTYDSCCSTDECNDEFNILSKHFCCLDIISQIVTDKDYTPNNERIIIYPAESPLKNTLFKTTDPRYSVFHIYTDDPLSPDLLFSIVLRC